MGTSKGTKQDTPEPGEFQPALPKDSFEVVLLFAIAGRAVCARPLALESITTTLVALVGQLVPPESLAAEECGRLWGLFGRMVQRSKPALLEEGGRALYRDLDALAQKLDLPPMDAWRNLPQAVVAAEPVAATPKADKGESLAAVRKRAKEQARKKSDPPLKASAVAKLVTGMNKTARDAVYRELVGLGEIDRSDTRLLEQVLSRGDKIKDNVKVGDNVVNDSLLAIGRWLVR
jgi:hypothetical protein